MFVNLNLEVVNISFLPYLLGALASKNRTVKSSLEFFHNGIIKFSEKF